MEAQAGLARVHRSTADKWVAETRRAPPATVRVDGGAGREMERAAEFDCAAGAFRPASAAGAGLVRERERPRRLSAPF